jgi:hypothetical protein
LDFAMLSDNLISQVYWQALYRLAASAAGEAQSGLYHFGLNRQQRLPERTGSLASGNSRATTALR